VFGILLSDSELDRILAEKSRRLVAEHAATANQVLELTAANFDKVVGGPKPAFIDFWAVWCGPCKTMEPVVSRLAGKLGSHVTFGKLNVDEQSSIATRYDVQSIPTFMLFKSGRPIDAVIGTMQEAQLEQRIRRAAGVH
jgi:thioredoxin